MAAAEIRLRSVLGEDDRAEANGLDSIMSPWTLWSY